MMRRQFRKVDDYLKIIENEKVVLVNDRYPSNKLIEKTKCVVTGVGTVASEEPNKFKTRYDIWILMG